MNVTATNPILEGPILKSLLKLALPIMGTSFIQMAYNMTDMIWLGRSGSVLVAAAGTAGFYLWFGMAFILISKVGTEIGVAQSVGMGNLKRVQAFFRNAVFLNIALAIMYAFVIYIFREPLIGFLKIKEASVRQLSIQYLEIVVLVVPFMFINPVITALYNGHGNSRIPFYANAVGLITNIVLDPIMIFGLCGVPKMGVRGAALATVISQIIVTIVLLIRMIWFKEPFEHMKLFEKPDKAVLRQVISYGLPVAFQSGMFTIFAMLIARQVASWGAIPIAVQNVGAQIESISWMTAGGFATALSTFVGQNYGAGHRQRVVKGYIAAMGTISIVGVIATLLLVFAGGPIFSVFIPEADAIKQGMAYLRILGYSQLFMCFEITTAGAFNGLGKTLPPSIVSFVLTGARVPAAIWLSGTSLKLEGIWWSIALSSIFKGIVILVLFSVEINALLKYVSEQKKGIPNFDPSIEKCGVSASACSRSKSE